MAGRQACGTGSSVYPCTGPPVVRTSEVNEPYMAYPAATISLPGRSTSARLPPEPSFYDTG